MKEKGKLIESPQPCPRCGSTDPARGILSKCDKNTHSWHFARSAEAPRKPSADPDIVRRLNKEVAELRKDCTRLNEARNKWQAAWQEATWARNKAQRQLASTECAEGWVACELNPCPRHVEYWERYHNQAQQIPEGQHPVPAPSRSVQRRIAAQKGEPAPTFEHPEPAKGGTE